jgi:hypothetical protein
MPGDDCGTPPIGSLLALLYIAGVFSLYCNSKALAKSMFLL